MCEIVDRGLRVTEAAHATHRSQSSVTRQIQLFEEELGIELFVRSRNRYLRLTPYGEQIVEIARRMTRDADNMLSIGQNATGDTSGHFTIATTNFQAKYVLPESIQEFIKKYPDVTLSMRQGTPPECCELVALGKADIAICAATEIPETLVDLPCYRLYRSVIATPDHPLVRIKKPRLEDIAKYPLITYDEAFNGSTLVLKTFAEKGLKPKIVLSAVDADVAKIYVAMGMGIAISASVIFEPERDLKLHRIDARHLFKPSFLSVILRRRSHLRNYMLHFVSMFAPMFDQPTIAEAVFGNNLSPVSRKTLPVL